MQKTSAALNLKASIRQLEGKQANELNLLKAQFIETAESLKLINIIKSSLKDIVLSPDLKTDTLNAAIGLTTGFVTKKLLIGKTINPLKRLFGFLVEMAVAKNVAENADGIKSIGSIILKKIVGKRSTPGQP